MKTIDKHIVENNKTPFYLYDTELLNNTLAALVKESTKYGYSVHYALKANSNNKILQEIRKYNLGADCVSGNEVKKAIENGYPSSHIVFAGVGKSDDEIKYALANDIFCFNCESLQEIEVINQLASEMGKVAPIALRINPNVDARTHHYITTGLEENKFGINRWELKEIIDSLKTKKAIKLIGIHFHIGSQITDLDVFKNLCVKVNEIQAWFEQQQVVLEHINVGGGLGIDYYNPDKKAIPDFEQFFKIFNQFLELRKNQKLHFEIGRAIVGQCGTLISKVLYIKNGISTNFAIIDAGMTDLIRPALYQSYHKIENISKDSQEANCKYDVVGPICESSDCFGKAVDLPLTERGDYIAIRTAGAYGEVMASNYNLREKPVAIFY